MCVSSIPNKNYDQVDNDLGMNGTPLTALCIMSNIFIGIPCEMMIYLDALYHVQFTRIMSIAQVFNFTCCNFVQDVNCNVKDAIQAR